MMEKAAAGSISGWFVIFSFIVFFSVRRPEVASGAISQVPSTLFSEIANISYRPPIHRLEQTGCPGTPGGLLVPTSLR